MSAPDLAPRTGALAKRWLLPLLACPECRTPYDDTSDRTGALGCGHCGRHVPIVDGIPRFVDTPEDDVARRTQASFGYEWTEFNDWNPSGTTNFADYFQGLDLDSLQGQLVLDAGCGMGRHSRQVAAHAGRVVSVDFSRAIEQASRNTADAGNVACVQVDLTRLPLRDGVFDFVYSLGVLHHITETEATLAGLVSKAKPGGRVRVYLYWRRHGWIGALLALVSAARLVTTRLPFPVLKGLCWLLSVALSGTVILPYRALSALGVTGLSGWPLFVYTKYPFNVLYNDQFDRFSAPLEKRYDPDEVRRLLEAAGLVDVTIRPCYGWIADGIRPA